MSASVLFLSCPPDLGRRILADVRRRWPDDRWIVYLRYPERDEYGGDLGGLDVRSEKPQGGRLRFVRGIRQQRFRRGVVVWGGHGDRWQMKVTAALAGIGELHVYNENLGAFELWPVTGIVAQHLRWRLRAGGRGAGPLGPWRALYTWTIGFVLGHAWLLLRWCWWQSRHAMHRPRRT